MGAANAKRAYDTWGSRLSDRAMRAFVYMALVSRDGDTEPWFGLGLDMLAERAFGRLIKDEKSRAAALRAVGRAMTELRAEGAVATERRARYGVLVAQNARYRLNLDGPDPGSMAPPDSVCPVAEDADEAVDTPQPPDSVCPEPPDSTRPVDNETTGQICQTTGHTLSEPPETRCPTKEEGGKKRSEERSSPSAHLKVEVIRGGKPDRDDRNFREYTQPPLLTPLPSPPQTHGPPARLRGVLAAAARAVEFRTGTVLTATEAQAVTDGILALASSTVTDPAEYVHAAVMREENPRERFLAPAPAPSTPCASEPRPPWCGERGCHPDTRRREHSGDGRDLGPCPRCHPGTRRPKLEAV